MSAAAKSVPAGMSEAELAAQKKRYRKVLLTSVLCVFVAFAGVYGHVTLHQVWGLPLFLLAMVAGFGTQIAFIVGLVKANRLEKGV
jgi:cyanate permease